MVDSRKSVDPLENLLAILLSRKWLAATGFSVVLIITILGAISLPPTYRAYTSIFISRPPVISRMGLPLSEEVTGRSFLANQVTIIQSRVIFERVVYRLNLHRRPVKKSFKSRTKEQIYELLGMTKRTPNPVEGAIEGLRQAVSVKKPRGTNIVVIETEARSAEFSATLANTVAEVYVEYAKELFTESTQSGYGFLEDQFIEAEERLAGAQRDLDVFKKREMSFLIPAESSVIAQMLGQLEEESAQIQAQLEQLRRERARAEDGGAGGQMLVASGGANPETEALEEELKTLRAELSNTLVYLKEDHPDVKRIRNRIGQVEGRIEEAAGRASGADGDRSSEDGMARLKEKEDLEARKSFIAGQIKRILAQRQALMEKQAAQEVLARDVARHRERAEALRAAVEQARAIRSTDLILESIKIVDRAFPPPFASRRTQLLLLAVGGVVGLAFGIGMTFIAEYFDESLKTAEEVEEYLDIPVLGVIPTVNRKL